MNLKQLYKRIENHKSAMDLNRPINSDVLKCFEVSNGIKLPEKYKLLLTLFNGGELFVPGITIYGIGISEGFDLKFANRSALRSQFRIPNNYLIFGKVNYGDFLCIDLKQPYDVIQWDHENDEKYCSWESIEEWLYETIAEYEKYEKGDA